MKLHQKGYLLVELHRSGDLWDDDIVSRTLREFGHTGSYRDKSVRVALEELAAAGLVSRVQSKLEQRDGREMVSFQYALTEFGRTRMQDTGLLLEAGS